MFKKYSDWKDLEFRTDYRGYNYLLQVRIADDGSKHFRNISVDNSLFHQPLKTTIEELFDLTTLLKK